MYDENNNTNLMSSKYGPGFVYAVAAGTAWSATTVGLTLANNPVAYFKAEYRGVMCPLNISRVLCVQKAVLAE